jgi:ATP-dependent RNA helicase RhlE
VTTTTIEFSALGLSPAALTSLAHAGYTKPTPIQAQGIPPALKGLDVIGCAATGTGKTAAFLLPIIERLGGKPGLTALVLAPTRELAVQIEEHARRFGGARGFKSAIVIGGVGMGAQIQALKTANLVIATPGRLVDHLQQGTVKFDALQVLVLDEADRMLDMGFKPQLTRILNRVPKKRQTLLFSATMAGEVADFAKAHLHEPVRVEVSRSGTTAARATQSAYEVSQAEKTALLLAILAEGEESTLVFTRTKRRADKLQKALAREGLHAERIHADRSQSQRQHALDGFKSGRYRVLVATDIAARGIDVAEIGHVVNFDLPHVPEDYVHRIGRTARASASGHASSFVAPEEADLLRDIERLTKVRTPRAEVPRQSPVFLRAMEAERAKQAHPGAPSLDHGRSSRPPGQAPGRHARSHPRKHASGTGDGGGGSSGGSGSHGSHGQRGQPAATGSTGQLLFSGGPRRRR